MFFHLCGELGHLAARENGILKDPTKRHADSSLNPHATVYRTLGSAEISVQHGPYGFRFGQLMFCRGVATDLFVGVMNHRQCGQQTPKYLQNKKTANLKHVNFESEGNVSTSNIFRCVRPVSPPPSSDAHGRGKYCMIS